MTIDPLWYGFSTANQQNMQQVQYLSWVNSRRNVWPLLGKTYHKSNKNKLVSSLKPQARVHISVHGSEITLWPTIWPETISWLWHIIFFISTKRVIPWTSRNTLRMKDYEKKKASICWKTHLTDPIPISMAEATNSFNILPPNSPNKQILRHHKLCQTGPCWSIRISGRKKTYSTLSWKSRG